MVIFNLILNANILCDQPSFGNTIYCFFIYQDTVVLHKYKRHGFDIGDKIYSIKSKVVCDETE